MNENKYQELLVKTAAYDPATMLLYKMAGATQAVTAAAKKGIIQKIIDGIVNQGSKLSQSITNLGELRRVRPMYKQLGEAVGGTKAIDADIRKELANILKNKLTWGAAGATALNGAAIGGAGYYGYNKVKGAKAPKAEAPAEPATDKA